MIGRPMATTEPKAISMMMMAAVMPMPSLDPGRRRHTWLMGLPPSDTSNPGCGEALGPRSITRLTAAAWEVGGRVVELHDGETGVPVGGHLCSAPRAERTLHARHVVERAERGHQPLDLGRVGRVGQRRGGLHDDVGRVAGLSGKAACQEVLGLLGRRRCPPEKLSLKALPRPTTPAR